MISSGFIADTAMLPMFISNLVNIVSANYFDVGFGRYAAVMVPVNLVSVLVTLGVLWLAFRREIPDSYEVDALEPPHTAIRDPLVFRAAFPLLAVLLVAYFVTAPFNVLIAIVSGRSVFEMLALGCCQ